jgi:ankyrin repeat protein
MRNLSKVLIVISIVSVYLLVSCGVAELHPYRFIEAGSEPLHRAAANGESDKVRMLISQGKRVDLRADTTHATPLHFASWKGQVEIVKLLLDLGADVNARTDWGASPLHYASGSESMECYLPADQIPPPGLRDNHAAVVALLIEHGADVNMKTRHGDTTALMSAAFCNAVHIAEMLIHNGADLNPRALGLAACRGPDVAILMINSGANVRDVEDYSGLTALHSAARCGHPDVAALLLLHGANSSAADRWGNTPLDLATDPRTITTISHQLKEP